MANVKLLFYGTEESVFENSSIECFANVNGHISIIIEDHDNDDDDCINAKAVVIDKETAIRFAKELRKQISILD